MEQVRRNKARLLAQHGSKAGILKFLNGKELANPLAIARAGDKWQNARVFKTTTLPKSDNHDKEPGKPVAPVKPTKESETLEAMDSDTDSLFNEGGVMDEAAIIKAGEILKQSQASFANSKIMGQLESIKGSKVYLGEQVMVVETLIANLGKKVIRTGTNVQKLSLIHI